MTLGAVGVVVIMAAWYVLLWSPKSHELTKAKADRAAAVAVNQEAKLKLAALRSAATRRDQFQATQTRLLQAVPEHSGVSDVIREVNAAAMDAGVGFVSVQPTPPAVATTGGPNEIVLAVQVQGSYGSVLAFLDHVMTFQRLVVIDGLSMLPKTSPTAGLTSGVTVSFTGRAFTTEAPAVKAAAPATPATSQGGKSG
jgi:Tfp pilus assembly protein PilO